MIRSYIANHYYIALCALAILVILVGYAEKRSGGIEHARITWFYGLVIISLGLTQVVWIGVFRWILAPITFFIGVYWIRRFCKK